MPDRAPEVDDATFVSAFVSRWVAGSLDVTPLTEADRREVEASLAALHEGLGHRWHGNVVWARSPQELRRSLTGAPALMRRPYLASRTERLPRLTRVGKGLSQGTIVLGYSFLATMITFLPAYYAGSLINSLSGRLLGPGGVVIVVAIASVLAGLFSALVLSRAALNSARQVFAPIGEDLDQRLRPLLTQGRTGLLDIGDLVRRAVAGLWDERLLEGAWTEGTPVRGFHRDGVLHDRGAVGAAHQAAQLEQLEQLEQGRRDDSDTDPQIQAALAGLVGVRRALVWVPYTWLTVVLEPPVQIHTEKAGDGVRLHRDDGPALVWADGQVEFCLHGVRIPAALAAREPTVRELHTERNSEVRRVLIEREGWEHYVTRAGLQLVGSSPDPGNPGRELRLYRTPPGVFDSDRLLLMTNGSPDRTGTLRHYAELVPGTLDDPVEAAAWQYGVPAEVYRELARRT
ncbi:DUF6745 domain-containing protein [Kineosporia sp. NBRC 101731]|uniref:DUF6745 domain-containing protein n=1 Tax=Kineosporia sp. NBRC 101731 TaxID=3032199 RepID=UPI0024A2C261|nr:hypothetical protein [Kineosporia sp. NBRC 101731]GLY27321.1 hypothetical protein Kisp02_06860 [Kineosporia sp. NBRC 101731]